MSNRLARRGWYVSDHAVDQFVKRVLGRAALASDLSRAEVADWLREHAWQATPTTERTRRGDAVYRLAHPWPGPDAAIVVKRDRDGTLAAVTSAWWEELGEPEPDPVPRHHPVPVIVHRRERVAEPAPAPVPEAAAELAPAPVTEEAPASAVEAAAEPPLRAEEIRAALARAVAKGASKPILVHRRERVRNPTMMAVPDCPLARPLRLPPRPADLPCPPGALAIGVDSPGQTLDPWALTDAQAKKWEAYLTRVTVAVAKCYDHTRPDSTRALTDRLKAARKALRQVPHQRALAAAAQRKAAAE